MKTQMRVVAVVAVLGALLAQPVAADDKSDMFKKLDVDGNGLLSKEEAAENTDLFEAFDDGDENGDDQIDMAEFAKLEIQED
jgi:hypothetical protein